MRIYIFTYFYIILYIYLFIYILVYVIIYVLEIRGTSRGRRGRGWESAWGP